MVLQGSGLLLQYFRAMQWNYPSAFHGGQACGQLYSTPFLRPGTAGSQRLVGRQVPYNMPQVTCHATCGPHTLPCWTHWGWQPQSLWLSHWVVERVCVVCLAPDRDCMRACGIWPTGCNGGCPAYSHVHERPAPSHGHELVVATPLR